jgi:hypothetical protein
VNLGPAGSVSANGGAGGPATGGGGFNAGGGGGGGRVLIQQNAAPLASGVSANGGAAIGSALPGGTGTVEQLANGLGVVPATLNVRLGVGSAFDVAMLSRNGAGSLYGYVDHVGAGFTGVSAGTPFEFAGLLGGGIAQGFPVTYATTSRTSETITVKSNGGDAILATGRGVGPTFATNMGVHPNTTINLGSTGVAHSAAFHLIVNNASTDLGVDSPLTALSILDVTITGPDAAAFSVDNLIPAVLYEGQHANLPIHFHPTEIRNYQATLTIRTDQGAASGAAGQTFVYQLGGVGVQAVPEPMSLALASVLAVATLCRRRPGSCRYRKSGTCK